MVKTEYKEFDLEGRFSGTKVSSWGSKNHHIVKFTNRNTGEYIENDYYMSKLFSRMVTEGQLLEAFECYLTEILSCDTTKEEFIQNLGYDEERGIEVYNQCVESFNEFREIYDGDIYELREGVLHKMVELY